MFTVTDAREATASCLGCTYTPYPQGTMENKPVSCPAVTVPLLSFPAAQYTLRDSGFFCFGVREALASAEKTEHVKGELFFLPFILFTLDSCCSGKVLGEISINNISFIFSIKK